MKRLVLIRHAKSSWDDPSLDDFDRPLNARGKRDAPIMGKRLRDLKILPDKMISSPAKRAYSTCKRIAKELGFDKSQIEKQHAVYHADPKALLSVIQAIEERHETIFLFGHNPGLTEFVNMVGKDINIENVPTCGVVGFEFDVNAWGNLSTQSGKLLFFDFPKKLL